MPLPGLRRVDHIGFTVPDLDQAHRFLVDVLGFEYLYSLGPFRHDDDWMATHLDVHPRAEMVNNRFFRCGGQTVCSRSSSTPRPTSATRSRATATSAATTSRCTSTTWTPPSRTCGTAGVRGVRRADREPRPGGGQPVDLLPQPLGHAVRAGLLPRRQGLRPGESAAMSTSSRPRPTPAAPRAPGSRRSSARRSCTGGSGPATGSARRTSPSGSAPAGCRCARRCGCWRPRASPSTSRTRARGSRGSASTRST